MLLPSLKQVWNEIFLLISSSNQWICVWRRCLYSIFANCDITVAFKSNLVLLNNIRAKNRIDDLHANFKNSNNTGQKIGFLKREIIENREFNSQQTSFKGFWGRNWFYLVKHNFKLVRLSFKNWYDKRVFKIS